VRGVEEEEEGAGEGEDGGTGGEGARGAAGGGVGEGVGDVDPRGEGDEGEQGEGQPGTGGERGEREEEGSGDEGGGQESLGVDPRIGGGQNGGRRGRCKASEFLRQIDAWRSTKRHTKGLSENKVVI